MNKSTLLNAILSGTTSLALTMINAPAYGQHGGEIGRAHV